MLRNWSLFRNRFLFIAVSASISPRFRGHDVLNSTVRYINRSLLGHISFFWTHSIGFNHEHVKWDYRSPVKPKENTFTTVSETNRYIPTLVQLVIQTFRSYITYMAGSVLIFDSGSIESWRYWIRSYCGQSHYLLVRINYFSMKNTCFLVLLRR